jgi:hypothetical protein
VNADIKKGTVIKENMLTTIRVEENNLISNPVSNMDEVLNMAAKQFIPKNAQLNKEFFESPDVILDKNQYVARIPSNWLIAIPSSIRRKDIACFYLVDAKSEQQLNNTISQRTNDGKSGQGLNTYIQESPKAIESINSLGKPVVESTVAYVKDSANREVVTLSKDERFDGSSQVSSIEVIITDQQMDVLSKNAENGYKFIVMYKDNGQESKQEDSENGK